MSIVNVALGPVPAPEVRIEFDQIVYLGARFDVIPGLIHLPSEIQARGKGQWIQLLRIARTADGGLVTARRFQNLAVPYIRLIETGV